MSQRHQRGMSLLETMLVLLLAGLALVAVLHLVPVAERELRVSRAINRIHTLVESGYRWIQTTPRRDLQVHASLLPILVHDHYLPAMYAERRASPWRAPMQMQLTQEADANWGLRITFTHVPVVDCRLLVRRVAAWSRGATCHAVTKGLENFTGEF